MLFYNINSSLQKFKPHIGATADIRSFKVLIVRSQLEYATVVWHPYRSSLITDIERVWKRVTKLVKGLRQLSYQERLVTLQLLTLK